MNKIVEKFYQIIILIQDLVVFIYRKYFEKVEIGDKVLYIKMQNPNLYHRYFYNFIKSFEAAGYTIIYPLSFYKYRNLMHGDVYLALMLKEKNTCIIKKIKQKNSYLILTEEKLSADYYKNYFEYNNLEKNSYHVPMSFHPYLYHFKSWDDDLFFNNKRINSVFCFGNFDREAYKTVNKAPFGVISRSDLIDRLSKFEHYVSVKSENHLNQLIEKNTKNKWIFVEKENHNIPLEKVRPYLSKFRYFLCCPGVFAPLSHNFTEAISAGCIPIIQKSYAELIYPKLEHYKNSIIFNNLEDLMFWSRKISDISEEDYNKMHRSICNYYLNHVHPASSAKEIVENWNKKIYLNASERSVNLIKNKL